MSPLVKARFRMLGAVFAFGVPFLCHSIFVLNHFYHYGAYMQDSGWFAWLLHDGGISLRNPPVMNSETYYGTHFAPLLGILSVVARTLPFLSHADTFAIYLGTAFGIMSLALYLTLQRWFRGASPIWDAVHLVLSWFFACGGLTIPIALYPHAESLIPGLHLMFYYLWFRGERRVSLLIFITAVLVREDSGFHFTAVLGLLAAYRAWIGEPRTKWLLELRMAGLGFLVSFLILVVQKSYFPSPLGGRAIYLGTPIYAHLSQSLLQARALEFAQQRAYLYLPMLIIVASSVYWKRPALSLGVVAFIPWFLLHVLAVYHTPAALFGYYAYPFVISLAWCLFGWLVPDGRASKSDKRRATALLAGVVLSSLLGLFLQESNGLRFFLSAICPQDGLSQRIRILAFLSTLKRELPHLGSVHSDAAGAALAPGILPAGAWRAVGTSVNEHVDVLIFNQLFLDWARSAGEALSMERPHFYRIPSTGWDIATTRKLPPPFHGLVQEVPSIWCLQHPFAATVCPEGYLIQPNSPSVLAVGWTYAELPPGKHLVEYAGIVEAVTGPEASIRMQVIGGTGHTVLVDREFPIPSAGATKLQASIDLGVDDTKGIKICLFTPTAAQMLVTGLDYR